MLPDMSDGVCVSFVWHAVAPVRLLNVMVYSLKPGDEWHRPLSAHG